MYKIEYYNEIGQRYVQYGFKSYIFKKLKDFCNDDKIEIIYCYKLLFSFNVFKKCWNKKLCLFWENDD